MYLEGAISSDKEDVLGNTFNPEEMDTTEFLNRGFLDIDHLMHIHGVKESVIGKPVNVWKKDGRLFARFLLNPTAFCKEIYDYVKSHPGVLSFSIAGDLTRHIFSRDGKWNVISCALTHSPRQPDAYAVALSANGLTIHGVMSAFAADLRHKTVDTTSLTDLYNYFKPMAGPVLGFRLATWARGRFNTQAAMGPVDLMTELRQNLFYPDSDVESFALDSKAHLAQWKLYHPEDEHLTSDGRYKSLEDAVAHLRYCERLDPDRVAMIIGRLRGRGDVIAGIDKIHEK